MFIRSVKKQDCNKVEVLNVKNEAYLKSCDKKIFE